MSRPTPMHCTAIPGVEAELAKKTEEGWSRLLVALADNLHCPVNPHPQHVPRVN